MEVAAHGTAPWGLHSGGSEDSARDKGHYSKGENK